MYKIPVYQIPKGRKFNEFSLDLVRQIQNDVNKEENVEKLFRLCYPLMLKEAYKYTDMIPLEDLDAEISLAFLNTLKYVKPDKENSSFIAYYKFAIKSQIMRSYYGTYTCGHKHLQKEFREFHSNIAHLEDMSTMDNGDYQDILGAMPDPTINIEEDVVYNDTLKTIYRAIDKAFEMSGVRGNKIINAKKIITTYIECKIKNPDATKADVARLCDTLQSNVSNITSRYLPRIKTILESEGYYI